MLTVLAGCQRYLQTSYFINPLVYKLERVKRGRLTVQAPFLK